MVELLKQRNYDCISFLPFTEYIKTLEKSKFINKIYQSESGYDEIKLTYENGENITILGIKEKDYEWITIYKINEKGEHYEQIEFMLYKENHDLPIEHNRVISFSAHFEDDESSELIRYSYFYLNNELKNGLEHVRKISIEDLPKIFYSKSMNLTELVYLADSMGIKIIESANLKGSEVKNLRLKRI